MLNMILKEEKRGHKPGNAKGFFTQEGFRCSFHIRVRRMVFNKLRKWRKK